MAVAFDAVQSTSGLTVSSLTWSHTCTGSNLVLIVDVITGNAATSASSVKYNNVSMTSIGKQLTDNQAGGGFVEKYYLINPSTGANNVVVTFSVAQDALIGGSMSFTGASQNSSDYTTVAAFGSSTTSSVVVTAPASTSMVTAATCCGSPVNSSANTQRWLISASSSYGAGCGAGSTAAGTGSNVTMSFTV